MLPLILIMLEWKSSFLYLPNVFMQFLQKSFNFIMQRQIG